MPSWIVDAPRRWPRSGPLLPAIALAVSLTNVPQPGQCAEEVLSLETIFDRQGHARAPSKIVWTESGQLLSFLWSETGPRDLWVLPEGADRPARLLEDGELHFEERTLSTADYQWSPDGSSLLLKDDGDLFLYTIADQEVLRLTANEASSEDARFSPDSTHLAFVRNADLWILNLTSGKERRLTDDGKPGEVLNGKPDWLYWEEIWNRRSIGFWWSPDGRRIAYQRFDEEGVPTHPIVDDVPISSPVTNQPYPKPGEKIPRVRIGVVDLVRAETTWIDSGDDDNVYLARALWSPDGSRLAVLRLSRDQTEVDLLLCDPSTGSCRVFLRERQSTWVDIKDDFALLERGRVIWGSDRDGWRRLYLYDENGTLLHPISPDGVAVSRLDRVVEEAGVIFFTGFRPTDLGAADRQLYRGSLDGESLEVLADESGWNVATVSPRGSEWVVTHSTANHSPRARLERVGGQSLSLPHRLATAYDRRDLPQWKFLEIEGPDGVDLPARMLAPVDFDPARRYPVIMYHYGGPGSQTVRNNSSARPLADLWRMRMAQRGFIIFNLDNQASIFFGKAGAERLHHRFGELELRAQLAAVEYLRSQPWVAPEHIGLWGWSGGGANTLYSIFKSPGTWGAAVAGAPVTDWKLYDALWTERYLGNPETNADGYRESSPITWATALEDPLLLVHGTGDDNVHIHNSVALSRVLVEAGLPFEQAFYPGEKHGFEDSAQRHYFERMERFFDRWLDPEG